jgi:hypothetical protein
MATFSLMFSVFKSSYNILAPNLWERYFRMFELDEISMVGNSMFTVQLNNRLKDLKGSKEDFGGVSIITLRDLFQLKPGMVGYIFTDVQCLTSYNILAPNLWKRYFRMFEPDEIMRQRESKGFDEILNR